MSSLSRLLPVPDLESLTYKCSHQEFIFLPKLLSSSFLDKLSLGYSVQESRQPYSPSLLLLLPLGTGDRDPIFLEPSGRTLNVVLVIRYFNAIVQLYHGLNGFYNLVWDLMVMYNDSVASTGKYILSLKPLFYNICYPFLGCVSVIGLHIYIAIYQNAKTKTY